MTPEAHALAEAHVQVARQCAVSLARRLPTHLDSSELEGVALEALCNAASRYDPAKTRSFAAWAGTRISWALAEHLRDSDPNSRKQLAAMKNDEVAVDRRTGREMPPVVLASLDQPVIEDGSLLGDFVGADDDLVDECYSRQLVEQVKVLPRRLGFVMLSRAMGFKQEEIAERLGVGAARISQLETEARTLLSRGSVDSKESTPTPDRVFRFCTNKPTGHYAH